MKGRWIAYSAAELDFIKARQTLTRSALHAEFVEAFGRDDVTLANLKKLCKRKRWLTGRWAKRTTPRDKSRRPRGKPAGYERLSHLGYVEIRIAETSPRSFVLKHRLLWEQVHGPVPEGQVLKCLDGNKQNTDPTNWEAVPRALLPSLSGRFGRGYDDAPAELKPTILAVAKLEHRARQMRKADRAVM